MGCLGPRNSCPWSCGRGGVVGTSLETLLTADLETLRGRGLDRTLRVAEGPSGSWLTLSGRRVVHLGSNNYLGLATHPRVVEAAARATMDAGVGSGASRLIAGNLARYGALEEQLAALKQTEAALVFSTGYMANLGVVTALAGRGDLVIADRLSHASLLDACRLSGATFRVYPHGDLERLTHVLTRSQGRRRVVIVTDGVFSMDGDLAPVPELVAVADRFGAVLVVDDAHGTGVLGQTGAGVVQHFRMEGRVPVQIGTLSKALGGLGGFLAGSRTLISYVTNRARSLIYSTALPPGVLAAASAALAVLAEEPDRRRRLWVNVERFRTGLSALGHDGLRAATPIFPLLVGDAARAVALAAALFDEGVFAPAVRPPSVPPGTSRLRMSVMATHTSGDLDTALRALGRVAARVGGWEQEVR